MSLNLPAGVLLLCILVVLVNQRHDFIFLEVDAFAIPKSTSPSFCFPKSSFLESQSNSNRKFHSWKTQSRLFSTSASAAYLESISYQPPTVDDGLLGATSKYLDALSSATNQLQATTGNYQYYSQAYANNEGAATTSSDATTAQVQATVEAAGTVAQNQGLEDQLVNEVVQRVTQEFSSALEAFAGEKIDSFVDSASTFLADSSAQYIWDIEEAAEKGRKGGRVVKETVQNQMESSGTNSNTDVAPEETLRELTSKLDSTFRSFKENLSSSTHTVTTSVAGSLRRETSQPNAAVQAAKQQESILGVKQKLETGALTPEALSNNAKEAADLASSVATKAITELETAAPLKTTAAGLEKAATATTSNALQSISETASSVDAAIGGVTSKASNAFVETSQGIQKSFGSIIANTNEGIEKALSTVAKTTTAASSSIAETTNAATSSIFETTNAATSSAMGSINAVGSSISSGASVAASSVSNSIGAVGASAKAAGANLANGVSSATSGVQTSVGSLGSSAKAAVITASPGTAATSGKVSAVALSASQGFGMPGNAYNGGGDVAGLIEMTVATILSIPRTILDATMMETNPDGMNRLMEGISGSLTNDILVPLSEPLRAVVASQGTTTPLDQAQAVLHTLQMVLALVVGIPRAALEGLTGLTIGEIQVAVSQTDVRALSDQLTGFASAVSTVLVSLLRVVAQAISIIVDKTGLGDAIASGQEELVSRLVNFVVEDLLPAILDGLFIILQQFAMLLFEGGSAILAAM